MVNWWFGILRIPLLKGIVTEGYPDSNPKPPGPKPPNLPFVDIWWQLLQLQLLWTFFFGSTGLGRGLKYFLFSPRKWRNWIQFHLRIFFRMGWWKTTTNHEILVQDLTFFRRGKNKDWFPIDLAVFFFSHRTWWIAFTSSILVAGTSNFKGFHSSDESSTGNHYGWVRWPWLFCNCAIIEVVCGSRWARTAKTHEADGGNWKKA